MLGRPIRTIRTVIERCSQLVTLPLTTPSSHFWLINPTTIQQSFCTTDRTEDLCTEPECGAVRKIVVGLGKDERAILKDGEMFGRGRPAGSGILPPPPPRRLRKIDIRVNALSEGMVIDDLRKRRKCLAHMPEGANVIEADLKSVVGKEGLKNFEGPLKMRTSRRKEKGKKDDRARIRAEERRERERRLVNTASCHLECTCAPAAPPARDRGDYVTINTGFRSWGIKEFASTLSSPGTPSQGAGVTRRDDEDDAAAEAMTRISAARSGHQWKIMKPWEDRRGRTIYGPTWEASSRTSGGLRDDTVAAFNAGDEDEDDTSVWTRILDTRDHSSRAVKTEPQNLAGGMVAASVAAPVKRSNPIYAIAESAASRAPETGARNRRKYIENTTIHDSAIRRTSSSSKDLKSVLAAFGRAGGDKWGGLLGTGPLSSQNEAEGADATAFRFDPETENRTVILRVEYSTR
ncbi:hypothetical protein BDZ89DRAFT_1037129 [Hymenopellis radicata]|nr:hypothetical protein BDZ89DRAFT_1037129 [Hymenopellis radicata]